MVRQVLAMAAAHDGRKFRDRFAADLTGRRAAPRRVRASTTDPYLLGTRLVLAMEVSRSIELTCPVPEAWRVLTDWERQAEWMRDADSVRVVSEHREGVGVRLAVRTRLFGIPAFTEPMEVVAWEPPTRLAIVHGGPVAGDGEWTIEPAGGGSVFTWTERVRLRIPLIGELAAWCYRPVMWTLMGRAQRGLRDAVASR
jgi:uncharacterized protein YndB with AHSA1/START domain